MSIDLLNLIIYSITIIGAGFVAFSTEIAGLHPRLSFLKWLGVRIFFAIIIAFIPSWASNKIQKIKDNEAEAEQLVRDSIYLDKSFRSDSSHHEDIKQYSLEITNAMGRYGFRYDSSAKEILKIVSDSIRSAPDPDFGFVAVNSLEVDTVIKNETYITINVNALQASLINLKTYFNIILRVDTFYVPLPRRNGVILAIPTGQFFEKDSKNMLHFKFDNTNYAMIYCLMTTTYTDIHKKKKYHYRKLVCYSFSEKKSGIPIFSDYERVMSKFDNIFPDDE